MLQPLADELTAWADDQRALARALGLTIEEWVEALGRAADRRTGLTAAVVGAAMARGMGMAVLDELDVEALVARARTLVDPEPPRVDNPILAEAIRRKVELGSGKGLSRLKRPKKEEVGTPQRGTAPLGKSATTATPDAPGDD